MSFNLDEARKIRDFMQVTWNWYDYRNMWVMWITLRDAIAEIERLQAPNACDGWGNPIVLSVSGSYDNAPYEKAARQQLREEGVLP